MQGPELGISDLGSSLGLAQLICFTVLDHGVIVHRIETKTPVALHLPEGRTEVHTMQPEKKPL